MSRAGREAVRRGTGAHAAKGGVETAEGLTDGHLSEEDNVHVLTIVCPVDYSECSKRALHYARALTERFPARLVVLHVFDPMLVAATSIQQVQLLGNDGKEELRIFVEDHLPASVRDHRLELVLKMGSPSVEILKVATAHDADLLVLGTHGFSGVRKALLRLDIAGGARRCARPGPRGSAGRPS
jgi:universal stress protein A